MTMSIDLDEYQRLFFFFRAVSVFRSDCDSSTRKFLEGGGTVLDRPRPPTTDRPTESLGTDRAMALLSKAKAH